MSLRMVAEFAPFKGKTTSLLCIFPSLLRSGLGQTAEEIIAKNEESFQRGRWCRRFFME